jgi:hypothetical protein
MLKSVSFKFATKFQWVLCWYALNSQRSNKIYFVESLVDAVAYCNVKMVIFKAE